MRHDGSHGEDCFGCRIKTVNLTPPTFQPHFNHALGERVESSRDFDEKVRVRNGGDEHSHLVRVDPRDVPTPTSDTEAIETSLRIRRDTGVLPPSTSTVIAL